MECQLNFPQVGQPGHREIEEEGEEALRRLEDAVSILLFHQDQDCDEWE